MNKDLRTVVEHKLAEHPQEAKVEEERVDLGALAPEGLPKDVTPEEIAALAAAAAQVKGKIAESHTAEPVVEPKAEHKSEVEEQAQSQAPQPVPEAVPQAATFAEQKSEEKSEEKVESKIEASAEKSGDAVQEPASIPTPSSSDVMAAIAGLESDAAQSANSGNGSWSHSSSNHAADEPITMAAAAGAGNGTAASRWTAVSVALAPEEAAIISRTRDAPGVRGLRRGRDGSCGTAVASTETHSSSAAPAVPTETASHVEEPTQDSSAPVPASPAPEAVQTLSAVASAATEAISAACKNWKWSRLRTLPRRLRLGGVRVCYARIRHGRARRSKGWKPHIETPEVADEEHVQKEEQVQREEQAQKEEVSADEVSTPVSAAQSEPAKIGEASAPDACSCPKKFIQSDRPRDSVTKSVRLCRRTCHCRQQRSFPASRIRRCGDYCGCLGQLASYSRVWRFQDDISRAIAARERSSRSRHSRGSSHGRCRRRGKAFRRALAAPESDADGIASIVDSVLADLRPKIFEEITRKMGKKK